MGEISPLKLTLYTAINFIYRELKNGTKIEEIIQDIIYIITHMYYIKKN